MQDHGPDSRPALPPTVRALGWTSFLTDLSSEAIYPLLPAFVIRELGGSTMSVGLIDGIANAVAAVVRLPAGGISDSVGRRPLVLLGYGFSAVVRPLMGLVSSPLGALVVRAADRFGKGIRSAPRDALVADLTEPAIRGRAFGWYALVQGLMALPAGLLAGWLWQRGPDGPAWAFTATAILAVVAAAAVQFGGRSHAVRPPAG